ncbi:hypothetical protein ACFHWY_28615, partial [Micromonospora sp. LOL_024]
FTGVAVTRENEDQLTLLWLCYRTAITSYDAGYRPLNTQVEIPSPSVNGALAGTYTRSATYKIDGSLATEVLPAEGGLPAETISYTYNSIGQPTGMASGQGTYVAGTSYFYDGLLSWQRLGAAGKQIHQAYTYTPDTRRLTGASVSLESQTSPGTFNPKYATEYGYDPFGNITSIAGTTDGVADQAECFRYDYLLRLTEAWTETVAECATPQRSGADAYHRSWTFDAVGNRLTQTDHNPALGNTTWTYQVGVQAGVSPHQVAAVSATGPLADTTTRNFAYDDAGQTTTRTTETGTTQTLTWTPERQVDTITEGASTTSIVYDADTAVS